MIPLIYGSCLQIKALKNKQSLQKNNYKSSGQNLHKLNLIQTVKQPELNKSKELLFNQSPNWAILAKANVLLFTHQIRKSNCSICFSIAIKIIIINTDQKKLKGGFIWFMLPGHKATTEGNQVRTKAGTEAEITLISGLLSGSWSRSSFLIKPRTTCIGMVSPTVG